MRTRSKVVVGLFPEEVHGTIRSPDKLSLVKQLMELRKWCRDNLKSAWRTYEMNAGGGTVKYFVVFEFDSQKDEMLFRLKQGI